ALEAVRAAADGITRRAQAMGATVRLRDVVFDARDEGKKQAVAVDGEIEVALGQTKGFWERVRLASNLDRAARDNAESKVAIAVASDGPRARVRDAESFRGRLLKLWAQRARDLAAEAQSAAAPLQIVDC